MADHTHIEWTDATWNPITGCSIVSPGCTNCYAMRLAGTRLQHHPSRVGLTTMTKAGPVWNGRVRLNEEWLDQPLRWKRPRRIFVCAHGDLFADGVSDDWIDQVFAVMALAPQHTFQVLTKRAKRMREYLTGFPARREMLGCDSRLDWCDWPLRNVWLGVSAERQQEADARVPELLDTPAALRFVSAEPLLGPIDFTCVPRPDGWPVPVDDLVDGLHALRYLHRPHPEERGEAEPRRIDWIIVGGESGPGARPMHPDWARSIRDQCAAAGVPFFFKQWGEWAPQIGAVDGWTIDDDPEISRFDHREWEDGRWSEPFRPMWCDVQDGNYDEEQTVSRIGKHRAGRLLDGMEHSACPASPPHPEPVEGSKGRRVEGSKAMIPGYWKHETSGTLHPAIMAYLSGAPMSDAHIDAMRAYLRRWIESPGRRGPTVSVLRRSVDSLYSRTSIDDWLEVARDVGIDPL